MSDREPSPSASSDTRAAPSQIELERQIRTIIQTAQKQGKVDQLTKRLVRDQLQRHFGVDLERQKKWLNQAIQDNVNELLTPDSPAPSPAKPSAEKKRKKPATSTSAKPAAKKGRRNAKRGSEEEDEAEGKGPVEEHGSEPDQEKEERQDGTAAEEEPALDGPRAKGRRVKAGTKAAEADSPSDHSDDDDDNDDEEDAKQISEFSSLEDEEPSRIRPSSPTKKARGGSTASKRKASGSASTSAAGKKNGAADRLTRLKSLVTAAGVRKPWKKLYAAAGLADDDLDGHCRIVQGVLRDIGITGRGSIAEARRIRAEREFRDEVAALQENEVASTTRRVGRGGGARRGARDSGESGGEDEGGGAKDEDEEESEDEGPKRTSFKSSLASFAAGLNESDESE